jgi:dipeptidyl aminopeptidase/acylaminoacyl peptidase
VTRSLRWLAVPLLAAAGYLAVGRMQPAPPPPLAPQLAAARAFAVDPGLQLAPRFSPDGRQVAFALAEGDDSRIVVQAVDGSSRRFIGALEGVRVSPVFFPDGRRLAYWRAADGSCGIFERDLASGRERRLLDCAMLPRVRFDISPDGRSMVFTGSSSPAAKAGLWLLALDGSAPRLLTIPPDDAGDDLHPRFSPDGRSVAFFRGREGLRQPWMVSIEPAEPARPLGRECGRCFGLAWLRDRASVVVAGDWYGQPGLREVAADGHTTIVATGDARFPDASASGDIVYERARTNAGRAGPSRHGFEGAALVQGSSPAQIDLAIARR